MVRWLALCSLMWAACTLINDYPEGVGGDAGGGSGGENLGGGGADVASCKPGYVCVPRASRIVRLSDDDAGDCGASWQAPVLFAAPTQPGCLACSCDPPALGTCTPGVLTAFTSNDCSGPTSTQGAMGCFSLMNSYGSYILEPSTPSTESCAPQGGGDAPLATHPLCVPAEDERPPCGDDGVCVADGIGSVCALVPLGSSCPSGYTDPVDIAEVVDDERDCTCSCEPSTGQSCDPSLTLYQFNGCVGIMGIYPGDGTCQDTVDAADSVAKSAGTWSGGSCAPAPQTGEVQFGATETLCCQ